MQTETLQLERLVDDPEIRRAAAKTLKGFCLTYLPHHFPLDPSDFFDEMCAALADGETAMTALQEHPDYKRDAKLEGATRIRAVFGRPGDAARDIILTVIIVPIPKPS